MKNRKYEGWYNSFWNDRIRSKKLGVAYLGHAKLVPLLEKNGRVLDIAAGNGDMAKEAMRLGNEVHAVDISSTAVALMKKAGIRAKKVDVESGLPYKNGFFDGIIMQDIVEHLFDPEAALQEAHRTMKKGGYLLIATPNISYWYYRIYFLLKGELPKTSSYKGPYWKWEHIRLFNLKQLKNLLRATGFEVEKVCPIDGHLAFVDPSIFSARVIVKARKT